MNLQRVDYLVPAQSRQLELTDRRQRSIAGVRLDAVSAPELSGFGVKEPTIKFGRLNDTGRMKCTLVLIGC